MCSTLEDHFTIIDLCANTGHNLGPKYTPAHLRAIRRFSIHKIFQILDSHYEHSPHIEKFLRLLADGEFNTVISTNWDVVCENHVGYTYGRIGHESGPSPHLRILKLHGSANWGYCDTCMSVQVIGPGKGALHNNILLRAKDFKLFNLKNPFPLHSSGVIRIICNSCDSPISARIATFSLAKAMDYFQFQNVWDEARTSLREAERWVFIGYSLPEADFEVKHLLKTSQLASRANGGHGPKISCVALNDTNTINRFRSFFGKKFEEGFNKGFEDWFDSLRLV